MNGYLKTEKKYPHLKKRIYFSKQKFTERIENLEWIEKNPGGHLYYWHNAYELLSCPRKECWRGKKIHALHNADIFWDEIADDIPREKWNELPEELKQIFSHARKRGNRIFANTQKYEMVAIDFRRQVDIACWCVKVFGSRDIDVTKPNPKMIFVFQMVSFFDPMDMENEDDPRNLMQLREGFPSFHFYTRRDVSVFDTEWEVPPTEYNRMKELKFMCVEEMNGGKCSDPEGHWRNVKHKMI